MPARRAPWTVLAAWLVTGPLGHLYGGLADVAGLLWARARRRGPWG
jgi:hypothetical protein